MRVGLDARTLAPDVRSGVESYVAGLVGALALLDDAPEIIAYTNGPIADPVLARAASTGRLRTRVIRARRGWLRAALPWRLWWDRCDLVHLPSTILPPLLPCPAVVTVHDLAWVWYPETYEPRDLAMQRVAVATAASRAAHIIAVSNSTARDLGSEYPESAGKTSVIPLGVSQAFSPQAAPLSQDAFPQAERLTDGYVLYSGRLQPRKNLARLLEAYKKVRDTSRTPPLVLAGAMSPHAQELAEAARSLGIADHVIFPGYVPEHLLPSLYRSATVFVYPSLYEGFGLPVLEAMASGVPTITSDTSGMAEVAGEAALLVDPDSVDQLERAISDLLGDESLRATLAERGLARSRRYTWERTARETTGVYRRVGGLGQGAPPAG